MQYKKIEGIAYNLHIIKTDKFKQTMVKVNFKNKLIKEDIVKRRIIPDVLVESNAKYNTKRLLDIRTEELYNLESWGDFTMSGSSVITSFNAMFLNDNYGEKGLLKDSLIFLFNIIFNPKIENNGMDKKAVDLAKKSLRDEIDALKEDKNEYALQRTFEEMSPDTVLSYHSLGYIEDLDKVDEYNLYEYYQSMVRSDIVDIFILGNVDFDLVQNIVKEYFKVNTKKKSNYNHYITHTKFRNRFKDVSDKIDNSQSSLILGYKIEKLTPFERDYVAPIYSYIFGGGPDSMLFKNVREKNSLCYSVSSIVRIVSNVMLITAGINASNYKKAVSLIKKNYLDMKNGKFDDSDIEKAKTTYLSAYKEIDDSIASTINTYVSHEYLGTALLDERTKNIVKVTKDDILKFIPKIHPEIVYFLEGTKTDEED